MNNKYLEKIEDEIISNAICKHNEPKSINIDYAHYIIIGKLNMLLELGIIDEKTKWKWTYVAQGKYDKEIYEDYQNAKSTDILTIQKYLDLEN